MAPGYSIGAVNGYDPYMLQALSSYNVNFQGAQQATQTQPQVQYVQADSTSTANLPKADYSKSGSDLTTGLLVAGTIATGAFALYKAYKKGDRSIINGVKKYWNQWFKSGADDAAKAVKKMKDFSFVAKDGSKIKVENGKITEIIKKGKNVTTTDAKEIRKILTKNGLTAKPDYATLAKTHKVKPLEYSFTTNYNGKTVFVENGIITKINGTAVNEDTIAKELGDKYSDSFKRYIEKFENDPTITKFDSKHKISGTSVKAYSWTEKGLQRTVKTNKSGKLYDAEIVTLGKSKQLTEIERNAYLEQNKDIHSQITSILEKGRGDGIAIARYSCFDKNGNKLTCNKDGEILMVELREPIKDSSGKNVKFLRDGHDRTLLDNWLHTNSEAKDIAKKEIELGLAPDGAKFISL